jgi:hypothetical protein
MIDPTVHQVESFQWELLVIECVALHPLLAAADALLTYPISEGLFDDSKLLGHTDDRAELINDQGCCISTKLSRVLDSVSRGTLWPCTHNCHDYLLCELSGKWGKVSVVVDRLHRCNGPILTPRERSST